MSANPGTMWARCLDSISHQISGPALQTWIEPLRPLALEQKHEQLELVIEAPGLYFQEWVAEHYTALLQQSLSRAYGVDVRVSFTSPPTQEPGGILRTPPAAVTPGLTIPPPPLVAPAYVPAEGPPLNRAYTFDRFVEGTCNRLARSAAYAATIEPGKSNFNPLFLYGGVGLGKTHLAQAITHQVRAAHPDLRVSYTSSEAFTSELLRAVQADRVEDFSAFYCEIDVLVVDDIQFLAGKEHTQEAFFRVFNALHQSGRQLVLCADRPPASIRGIEERLLSRFASGLSVAIQPPDSDTRASILRRKAELQGLALPEPVINYIAQRVTRNVRELEGALHRLVAHSALQQRPLTLADAGNVLQDLLGERSGYLEIESIQAGVARYYRMTVPELLAKTRKREIVSARQVAMYLSKQNTPHTYLHIGKRFGGVDHSTVIHACTAVQDRIDTEPAFRTEIEHLQTNLFPEAA